MIRLVTRGRFTKDYAKGLLAAPEDREPAVRKLVEGAGGKLVNFYFTTGDSDFLLITETNEAEFNYRCVVGSSGSGRHFRRDDFKSLDWCRIQSSRGQSFQSSELVQPAWKEVVARHRKRTSGAILRMSALCQ